MKHKLAPQKKEKRFFSFVHEMPSGRRGTFRFAEKVKAWHPNGAEGSAVDLSRCEVADWVPVDTTRFGKHSGLGLGRPKAPDDSCRKRRKRDAYASGGGGGDDGGDGMMPRVPTTPKDLIDMHLVRSIVYRIEETRNVYSARIIREMKRVAAALQRMIEEYEMRQMGR